MSNAEKNQFSAMATTTPSTNRAAMANSAGTKTLWEQIMGAKDHASPIAGHITQIAAVPDAPLKEPAFTPIRIGIL